MPCAYFINVCICVDVTELYKNNLDKIYIHGVIVTDSMLLMLIVKGQQT